MIHSFRSMLVAALGALVILSMPTAALAQLVITNHCDRPITTTIANAQPAQRILEPAWTDIDALKTRQEPLPAAAQNVVAIAVLYLTSTGLTPGNIQVTLNPDDNLPACAEFHSTFNNTNACIPAIQLNAVGHCRIIFYKRNF